MTDSRVQLKNWDTITDKCCVPLSVCSVNAKLYSICTKEGLFATSCTSQHAFFLKCSFLYISDWFVLYWIFLTSIIFYRSIDPCCASEFGLSLIVYWYFLDLFLFFCYGNMKLYIIFLMCLSIWYVTQVILLSVPQDICSWQSSTGQETPVPVFKLSYHEEDDHVETVY